MVICNPRKHKVEPNNYSRLINPLDANLGSPCTSSDRRITVANPQYAINVLQQKKHTVYSFVMSAEDLAKYAKVDRFGESSDGVNRKLDESHALKIATAMIESDSLMLDAT